MPLTRANALGRGRCRRRRAWRGRGEQNAIPRSSPESPQC